MQRVRKERRKKPTRAPSFHCSSRLEKREESKKIAVFASEGKRAEGGKGGKGKGESLLDPASHVHISFFKRGPKGGEEKGVKEREILDCLGPRLKRGVFARLRKR